MRLSWFRILLLIFLIYLIPAGISGQPVQYYQKGEIRFINSPVQNGYIWLKTESDGSQYVFFKQENSQIGQKYSAEAVDYYILHSKQERFKTEEIVDGNEIKVRIMQHHFSGEYELFSYFGPEGRRVFLKDKVGYFYELKNTLNKPITNNYDYKIEYNKEYLDILESKYPDVFNSNEMISEPDFKIEELTSFLSSVHELKGLKYSEFTYRLINGYYMQGGISYTSMKHESEVNSSFSSSFPFLNLDLSFGMKFYDELFELEAETSYSYGKVFHDETIDLGRDGKSYIEDNISLSLLSLGVNFGMVLGGKRVHPIMSIGGNYSFYSSYSRELTDDLLLNNVLESTFSDSFDTPKSFPGWTFKAGFVFDLSESTRAGVRFIGRQYFGNKPGPQGSNSLNISYIRNIRLK